MKLRLEGTPAECEQAVALLGQTFDVVLVSDPYPNRGRSRLVRVYIEARLNPERPRPAWPCPPSRHGGGSCSNVSTGSCLPADPH
jgi:hypothetical protein